MNDGPGPDLLDALWRYKKFVVAVTLAVFALSTAVGLLLTGQATAEATVALKAPSAQNVVAPGVQGDAALGRYSSQRALFAQSDQVLRAAAARLPGSTLNRLRGAVTVEPSSASTSMVVRARAATAQQAVDTVAAVVQAYREQTREQVRERSSRVVDALQQQSDRLRATLRQTPSGPIAQSATQTLADITRQVVAVETDGATFDDGVDFVRAATPQSAVTPGLPYREMALGLLLGVAVASTAAWLRADRNRRLTRPRQAENMLEAPLLGELPRVRRTRRAGPPVTEINTHCRDILAPVLNGGFRGALMVTAATHGAGVSTLTLGLATAAAVEGLYVLVIDADPGSKGLTARLGLDRETPGFVEATLHKGPVGDLVQQVEVAPGVKLSALAAGNLPESEWPAPVRELPSGHVPTGSWAVTAAAVQALLDSTRRDFDMVVIDAPTPTGEYVSSVLTGMVDGVITVVRHHEEAERLAQLHHLYALNRAPVIGYIYNLAQRRDRAA